MLKILKNRCCCSVCTGMAMVLLLNGFLTGCFLNKNTKNDPVDLSKYYEQVNPDDGTAYLNYSSQYKKNNQTKGKIISLCNTDMTVYMNDSITFTFMVETPGLYRLKANIGHGSKNLSSYSVSLKLNNTYPFEESGQLYFNKNWVIDGDFSNDTLPKLKEETDGYTSYARSDKNYYSDDIFYYLEAGENTVILTANEQQLPLHSLEFEGYSEVPETAAGVSGKEQSTDTNNIVIQGENPKSRSQSSITEQIDRISPATQPVCNNASTYNTIGGTSWETLGESVTWEFQVQKTGWYQLNFRCRQDYSAGVISSRKLLIDDSVYSADTEIVSFGYSAGWQKVTVNNEAGQPVWFHLTQGVHTVTLRCTMGELEQAVEIVRNSLTECESMYRDIIMITGTNPDSYRDYHLAEKIPDVFVTMQKQIHILDGVVQYLSYINNKNNSDAAVFTKLIRQMSEFVDDPDEIVNQVSSLNANISAIGTWLLERTAQPLEIDWLEFQPNGAKGTPYQASLFENLKHSLMRIISSYNESYDNLGGAEKKNEADTIDVWAVTGRDQAQIIQKLCDESFTEKYGSVAKMKLVAGNSIMAATVAGIGPDITLFNTSPMVINYALRNAAADLSGMAGYKELVTDFFESALTPYRFNGGIYALPETQSFPVLFYRSKILADIGLPIPQTWEETYDCIATLQKNNMTFGCCGYDLFLYQNGGTYYKTDGSASLLNSEASVKAFQEWTKFYTNFKLPLSFNFINRFRTGEMPLAVADYTMYNSLVVFAPEIRDEWDMALVPGTRKADGTIDRSVNSGGTGAMIFKNSDNIKTSWNFLKWWVSGNTQSEYAQELEVKLGTSARVPLASKSAFENQLWTQKEKEILKAQWKCTVGTPEVAGGYLVTRHINNAFRKIVYNDEDIRETLNEYTTIIDKEIDLKREEYGLDGGK